MEKTIKAISQLLGLFLLLLIALPACGQQAKESNDSSMKSRKQLNAPVVVQEKKQTRKQWTADEIAKFKKENPRKRQAQNNGVIEKETKEVILSKEDRKIILEKNITGLRDKLELATDEERRKLIKKSLDEASKKLEEGNY